MSARKAPSRYGKAFDDLADRWANLEHEHDEVHPERSQCGGIGGCSMMLRAHDLAEKMEEQLEIWRDRRQAT